MKLITRLNMQNDPFEGDRTRYLNGLPAGARVEHALVTVTPRQAVETITFNGDNRGAWGATREVADGSERAAIDLHARRLVSRVTARSSLAGTNATVQADIGGVWVRLAADGSIAPPNTPPAEQLQLTLGPGLQTAAIPPLTVQRLQLTRDSGSGTIDLRGLTLLSYPTNFSLRLGQLPPFWPRPGELTGPETGPDFAEVLQAFLAGAEVVNGFYQIPLIVHSDTIARLDLAIEITYTQEQAVLPAAVNEATLTFDYNSLPIAEPDLLQIALPAGARVTATAARVQGGFQPSRVVYGPTGAVNAVAAAPLSPDWVQAQPLRLAEARAATAIDLLLAAEDRLVELTLTLMGDNDGKPDGRSLLNAPVSLTVDREQAAQPTWLSAELPAPFQFAAKVRYWLVLQARDGRGQWSVQPAPAEETTGLQFTADNGLSWRTTTLPGLSERLAGFFRLRHLPERYSVPIAVQVGAGEQARRVSLERFQPLGRLDFNLDFPELAEAINGYAAAAPPPCAGEHLLNGEFQDWLSVGGRISAPLPVELAADFTPLQLAIAPDGEMLYLGGRTGQNSVVRAVSAICGQPQGDITLGEDEPQAIALHPDGNRLYVLTPRSPSSEERRLALLDPLEMRLLGEPLPVGEEYDLLAVSPDGGRLYLAGAVGSEGIRGQILVLDPARLEDGIQSGQAELTEILLQTIDLGDSRRPQALATDQTGRLYVALTDEGLGQGVVTILGPGGGSQQTISIPDSNLLHDLAPSPDGRWVLVSGRAANTAPTVGRVYLLEPAAGTVTPVSGDPNLSPTSGRISLPDRVAVSPDGRRAFVTDQDGDRLLVIDPTLQRVVQAFSLRTEPQAVAVVRRGDWVYAIATNREGFSFLAALPIGLKTPADWALTAGVITPFCLAEPFRRVALLGYSLEADTFANTASALSQVVPVGNGCAYDFSFWARASDVDALAEVIWLGGDCGALRTDTLPIEPFNQAQGARGNDGPPDLLLHRAHLTPPSGATQAEIRFSAPPDVAVLLDRVSFAATAEGVTNGDLQGIEAGALTDWTLEPGTAQVSLTPAADGMRLENETAETATLSQLLTVKAGQPFTLSFAGRVLGRPADSPRLALAWSGAGDPVTLTLTTGDGPSLLRGSVPAGATGATLRLILPPRTGLVVQQISFVPQATTTVPLTFVAQAPGEMTVSDFRIAYDMAAAGPATVSATGLCTPTPPGSQPGGAADNSAFCPCCGAHKMLQDPQLVTQSGRPALRGSCPDCGAEVVRPGGGSVAAQPAARPVAAPAVQRPAARVSTLPAGLAARLQPASGAEAVLVVSPPPPRPAAALTAIMGIGPVRAARLTELGINSLARLANAQPREIAGPVQGVSLRMAADFIDQARRLR